MIKNYIFDVGDVLIEFRWKEMLMDSGLSDSEAQRIGDIMFNDPMWGMLDEAKIPFDEVVDLYKMKYPSDGEKIAWFITHGELMHVGRPEVWKKMRILKDKGYNIYLLSNYAKELFEKHTAGADFMNFIDGKVVSYEVQMTKPNLEIYKYLLKKYNLNPLECRFFDDRFENVEAAIKLGIDGKRVMSKIHLLEMLDEEIKNAD